jgi:Tfp pilus assembly protein FimT
MLAVAGLLLAIGIPSFARYQRSAASRNAFRQVVADLRLARQKALAEHHNFVAVFSTGVPGSYGIFADQDNDLTRDAGERWIV